ncbi:uncharacterized protein [Haliotis cracherodii]|uniref:uncharacterized protein n=1 Tax=Haliotis cracherodii TaxID=6455 RepID=UPI0039E7936B
MAANNNIDVDDEFHQMTVKELREYLRERNQKVTGVRAQVLARARGAKALRLDATTLVQPSKGVISMQRKLVTPSGYRMPDPTTLMIGWNDAVESLPEFSEKEIYNYMVLSNHRTSDKKPMMAKRQMKAVVFYQDRHVHGVALHDIHHDCDHMFVRCRVIPSLPTADARKSPDHDVWASLSKVTGRVHSANCTCAAGAGEACNHVSALLQPCDISQKKKDGLLSCTSVECKWKIPRKRKLDPMKSDDLNLMSSGRKSQQKGTGTTQGTVGIQNGTINKRSICPNSNMPQTTINLTRFNKKLIGHETKSKCGYVVNTTTVTQAPEPMPELPKIPCIDRCIPDYVDIKSPTCQTTFQNYFDSMKVSEKDVRSIERMTRGQHKTKFWKEARLERITSSQFGKVFIRQTSTAPDRLVCDLMGYRGEFGNRHTRWGLSHESAARRQYINKMAGLHPQLKVSQCGLIVNTDYPYLATSPDGLVSCTDCSTCSNQHGLVEIKCPSVFRDLTPEEAASNTNFFCHIVDNNVTLKENHAYYFQVQGQMALTKRTWCDFVVWTLKGISIERITFDENKWHQMVTRLRSFYLSAIIPEKYTLRVQRGVSLY